MTHLQLLRALLAVARAGALFPETRAVAEWLKLLATPWRGKTQPKLELHPASGFPTRRSLARMLERQKLARAFFTAHRARPARESDQYNVALAAAELWRPGLETKVMSARGKATSVLAVLDAFEEKRGTLVRWSLQLTLQGRAHVRVEQGTRCAPTGPFIEAVTQACNADATAAAVRLSALDGVKVTEVVRGELGPVVTRAVGDAPFGDVVRAGAADDAALSLLLERVGSTVSGDFCADAWASEDAFAAKRAPLGFHRSRERKLVCTPGLEAALRALGAGSRMPVRSR